MEAAAKVAAAEVEAADAEEVVKAAADAEAAVEVKYRWMQQMQRWTQ